MNLSERVRHYYLDHFPDLPQEKQFHFASRLAAWSDDAQAAQLLEDMRDRLLPQDADMGVALKNLVTDPPKAFINALAARQPYFDAYPGLRGITMGLFRVRHLLHLYNADVRDTFLELYPAEALHATAKRLAADGDALRILSTYAINYLYLVERILYATGTNVIDTNFIISLKSSYNLSEPEDVQLLIYLYTHCIIGESNFYKRKVAGLGAEDYKRMLEILEPIITEKFDSIHLDNKLEFLVCCKICDYKTTLTERILAECEQSVSPDGTFLVDTINTFKQTEKMTFAASEHRNVLFIMASSDFTLQR